MTKERRVSAAGRAMTAFEILDGDPAPNEHQRRRTLIAELERFAREHRGEWVLAPEGLRPPLHTVPYEIRSIGDTDWWAVRFPKRWWHR